MDAELKAKWVKALRSGEYKQGKGYLYDSRSDLYCCLGVLCLVQGAWRESLDLRCTSDVPGYDAGLDKKTRSLLADTMNDYGEKSFEEIADYIEKNL